VIGKFPKTVFSAEACYRLGTLYHDKVDSLEKAKEYFSRVGQEAAESEFATEALKKANSIGRLIEFEKIEGGKATEKQKAEKLFYSAEIQLEQFGRVERALDNYSSLLDSFPRTEAAPRAAYAIGWIYSNKLEENDRALAAFRRVVKEYPRSPQATGALDYIEKLGGAGMRGPLKAYIDSVRAVPIDTVLALQDSLRAGESESQSIYEKAAGSTEGKTFVHPAEKGKSALKAREMFESEKEKSSKKAGGKTPAGTEDSTVAEKPDSVPPAPVDSTKAPSEALKSVPVGDASSDSLAAAPADSAVASLDSLKDAPVGGMPPDSLQSASADSAVAQRDSLKDAPAGGLPLDSLQSASADSAGQARDEREK
jgi:hypothetical protein